LFTLNMGGVCGKDKSPTNLKVERGKKYHNSIKVVMPPKDEVFTRKKEWVGLKNLHNTCYINSVLQSFSASNYFMGYIEHLQVNIEGTFTEKLRTFLLQHRDTSEHNEGFLVPTDMVEAVYETFPMFERGMQEDAHEFLLVILDRLHSESKIADAVTTDFKKQKTVSVQKLWENYLAKHGSITSRVFEGLQRVSICCTGCKKVDQTCESFSVISLGLGEDETKLEKILIRNFQPEAFVGDNSLNCDRCKKKCPAAKRSRIIQVPQVLVMTLKRFEYEPKLGTIKKIDREIHYPSSGLSLPLQVSEVAVKIELFAVICQAGSISSGHYYSIIKSPDGNWYCCNDDKVTKVESPSDKNAYILFYRKTNQQLTQSETFAPVKLAENKSNVAYELDKQQTQVGEGEPIVCSRVTMDNEQFSRSLKVQRAPTQFVKKKGEKVPQK